MEVFSFGNGDFLFQIFTAIKGIMGDGSFATLMRIAIFGGFLVLLYQLFFSMNIATVGIGTIKHYIFIIIIVSIMFIPKTDIVIRDEIKNTQTSVTNVPLGIGLMAHFFTTAERGITTMTENYFSTPDDLKFYNTGYAFSVILMDTLKAATPSDPYFKRTLDEYIVNCFFHDVLWGDIDLNNFINQSNNIFADMAPQHSSNIYTRTFNASGTQSVTCQSAYGYLTAGMGTMGVNALNDLNKTMGINVSSSTAVVAQYMLDVSASTTQILHQAIGANAIKTAMASASLNSGLSGDAVAYATALAEQQQRSSWAVGGELSKKYIPIMRQVLEAFVYGLFPVIFVMMLTPAGPKVLKMYFTLMVWLLMWSPLFAILNLIVNTRARGVMSPIYGYYTLGNMPFIYQSTNDLTAMAGYLAWLVPTLAFAISNLSGYAITAMASSIAGSVTAAAGTAATSISSPQGASSTAQMAGHMKAAALMGENSWSAAQSAAAWNSTVSGSYNIERGLSRLLGQNTGQARAQNQVEQDQNMSATERVQKATYAAVTTETGKSGHLFDEARNTFAEKYKQGINPNANDEEINRGFAAYLATFRGNPTEAMKTLNSIAEADLKPYIHAGAIEQSKRITDAQVFEETAKQFGGVARLQKLISSKNYGALGTAISDFASKMNLSLQEAADRMGTIIGQKESISNQAFATAGYDNVRHAEINKSLNEAAKFEMTYQFAKKFFGAKNREDFEAQYRAHLAHHGQETYSLTTAGARMLNEEAIQRGWSVRFNEGDRVTVAMDPETQKLSLAKGERGARSESYDFSAVLKRNMYQSGSETLTGHRSTHDDTKQKLSGTITKKFDEDTYTVGRGPQFANPLYMALNHEPAMYKGVVAAYQANNLAQTAAEKTVVSAGIATELKSFVEKTGAISTKAFINALAEVGVSTPKIANVVSPFEASMKLQGGVGTETRKAATVNLITTAIDAVQSHALQEGRKLGYTGTQLQSHVAAKVGQFVHSWVQYATADREYGLEAPGKYVTNVMKEGTRPITTPEDFTKHMQDKMREKK